MEIVKQEQTLLGSVISISLPFSHQHLFESAFSEIKRIEKTYSRFLDDSELSKLNQNIGQWQTVSIEMIELLKVAQLFYDQTNGSFDITLKKTLENLGYDKNYSFTPQKIHDLTQYQNLGIELDELNLKVKLEREIEFGGFGKGFALDCVKKVLEKEKLEHYCINAGGDIFARKKNGEKPWIVFLEHPDDASRIIGQIEVDGFSIAASAPNRRKWGNLHHLINAKTKEPVQDVKGIFVTARTGIEADGYATAIFTSGFEEGIKLSQKLPVDVLLISSQNKVYQSKGFDYTAFSN